MAFVVSLPEIYRSLDVAWNDAIKQADYVAQAEAARVCLMNQTARVEPGEIISGTGSNAKKRTVRVHWLNACAITDGAAGDECAVASTELTDDSKTYTIGSSREASFKVSWKDQRTRPHNINEMVATGLLTASKALDEYISHQYLAFLAANNGAHEVTYNVGSNGAGNVWQIEGTSWTVDLMMEFALGARFSRFPAAYAIHGLNLWRERFKAGQYAANDDGKGENNLFSILPMYWDPIGFSEASIGDMSFVVNKASVALATGNYYDTAPLEFGGNHRMYRIPSRNLPGVSYDVHEIETCTSNDMVVSYRVTAHFDFFLNPTGCNANRTGILQFEKIAGA